MTRDLHVIADVLIATLLAPAVRLIVLKGVLEPAAGWAGRCGWHALDRLLNDRLPDLP
jgi:hypothetical protein